MRIAFLLLLFLVSPVTLGETPRVVTIPVISQPAAALVEAVRPLLGDNGGVSAFHDKLIVRGTAAQVRAVQELLSELDRPARRLLIEVRQSGQHSLASRDFGYGVDTGNVRLGRTAPGAQAGGYYRDLQTHGHGDGMQRVQALDGRPARIRAGQSVPVYQAHQQVIGNQVVQGFNMHYRDATSGFFALPRVHGDQVTVEIYQHAEHALPGGRFAIQHAATVLRGQLGQWLVLGGFGGSDGERRDAVGRHAQTRRAADGQIELRVLAVD